MRSRNFIPYIFLVIFTTACVPQQASVPPTLTPLVIDTATPEPTQTLTRTPTASPQPTETATPTATPTPAPVVLIGAGDIALCGEDYTMDEQTASIIERFPEAHVFTAGDNAYGSGTAAEFRSCFGPSWGRFKERIRPSPGNHEYMTEAGAPYYNYFEEAAGEAGQGYYSYNIGDWHIVGLNSNCNDIACGPESRQVQWLREDLQNNTLRCTLLYWHHPRWSSGLAGGSGSVSTFWRVANEFGAEVVVNGHDHNYERFAPQDSDGNPDPNGVRQFIVGSGGALMRDWGEIKPNSEVRNNQDHGVIKFNLYPDRYEWEFLPVDGGTYTDTGTGVCR